MRSQSACPDGAIVPTHTAYCVVLRPAASAQVQGPTQQGFHVADDAVLVNHGSWHGIAEFGSSKVCGSGADLHAGVILLSLLETGQVRRHLLTSPHFMCDEVRDGLSRRVLRLSCSSR